MSKRELKASPAVCCHCKAAPAIGQYCAQCYGAVLHPDGLPMVPGDPDDPWAAFNAEADAYIADQKMPRFVGLAIERAAYRRTLKGIE